MLAINGYTEDLTEATKVRLQRLARKYVGQQVNYYGMSCHIESIGRMYRITAYVRFANGNGAFVQLKKVVAQ